MHPIQKCFDDCNRKITKPKIVDIKGAMSHHVGGDSGSIHGRGASMDQEDPVGLAINWRKTERLLNICQKLLRQRADRG
jgi:hypothetical protein